jgi:SNF2 family DNA or RNA helicase
MFCVPADDLAAAVGAPATGAAILLLPSLRTAPLDSPELVRPRQRPTASNPPVLAAWTVDAVWLAPADAFDTLASPPEGLRLGASARFAGQLAQFAQDLAERGRFLPTVDRVDGAAGSYRARWRPLIQGPDLSQVQALVAAMPPVFRALTDSPGDTRGQAPAARAAGVVDAVYDAAVRRQLAQAGIDLCQALPRRRGRSPATPPVVEVWLRALGAASGDFQANAREADQLIAALASWDAFGEAPEGPARLLLRVVEPLRTDPETDPVPGPGVDPETGPDGIVRQAGPWRVEFMLQSVADPSLQLSADQVWAPPAGLGRWLDRPDELLLGELGRAAGVCPRLAAGLRSARPEALELDAAGMVEFLEQDAPLLEQAGFAVLLPSWWTRRPVLGLLGKARSTLERGDGVFGAATLYNFEWRLALGDQDLTDEELEFLASAKEPLVQLRGAWLRFDPLRLGQAIEYLRAGAADMTAAAVIELARAHADDLTTPLPVTGLEADGLLGALLDGAAEHALAQVQPPDAFAATLRPYQSRGLAWLNFLAQLSLGGCLADDMGLGKTVQLLALEALERAGMDDSDRRPTLIVAPMSVVGNWQREAARFAPFLLVTALHGATRPRGDEAVAVASAADIVLTTYQTATRDVEDLERVAWRRVALDEAQAVKNTTTKAAQAVRRLGADQRLALTGTPVENRLAELRAILDFCNPGMLGSAERFKTRFAGPIERTGDIAAAERLKAITRPYILRRVKTDTSIIDDLPPKIEMRETCFLTPEQASLYQAVLDDMMRQIAAAEGFARSAIVLATMMKLKQVCNHPAQFLHTGPRTARRSGKMIRLAELTDELLAEGDKALIFTQFTEFGEMLVEDLATRHGRTPLYLHGQVPKARRDAMVEAFSQPTGPPLFVLSLKAGGTGLNLTEANHVIHVDRWWNPAVENQATDRAFRIGQKRGVQVRKFVCAGTLEERVDKLIEEKQALAELVVGSGENWITELSTAELRDVFALSKEAVGE